DEVVRGLTVTHEREVLWPPPPVSASALPSAPARAADPPAETSSAATVRRDPRRGYVAMALAAVLFTLVATVSPAAFVGHFTVFALAVIVGFYVISNVTHALHTPLLAETNAISGIIL